MASAAKKGSTKKEAKSVAADSQVTKAALQRSASVQQAGRTASAAPAPVASVPGKGAPTPAAVEPQASATASPSPAATSLAAAAASSGSPGAIPAAAGASTVGASAGGIAATSRSKATAPRTAPSQPAVSHHPEPIRREPDYHSIQRRAYEIWLREGCPDGRADENWRVAVEELRAGR